MKHLYYNALDWLETWLYVYSNKLRYNENKENALNQINRELSEIEYFNQLTY